MTLVAKLRYLRSQAAFQKEPLRVGARLCWWFFRSRFPRAAVVHLRPWKLELELPPLWRGVPKLVYAFRELYEPELVVLGHFVHQGYVAVDVGANIGVYTCVLARLVGRAGHVYAFEPALQAATTLRRNLQRNGLSWVEFHRAACCESAGLGILHHEADWSRNWLAKEELAEQKCRDVEEVDTVALDNIVARADFIKIHVEGSELRVLEGARRLLGGCRPVIQFEINAEAAQRTGVDPLGALKFLRSQGYRFLRLRGAPSQFSFEWTEGDYDGNVFAVPVDRGSAFMPNGKGTSGFVTPI